MLTDTNKKARKITVTALLHRHDNEGGKLLSKFVTDDETLVHFVNWNSRDSRCNDSKEIRREEKNSKVENPLEKL